MKKGSAGSKRPYAAHNGSEEDQAKRKERQQQKQPVKAGEALAAKESAVKKEPVVKAEPSVKPEPPVKAEPAVKDEPITATASSIPAIDKLRRFCFIGSTDAPVYTIPTLDVMVESSYAALQELCGQVGESELVECLASVLGNGPNAEHLPRADEPLLILAVFLSTHGDIKQRKIVRNKFPDLVAGERELLLFVQLVKRLQKVLDRKTPFNRTVRKAVLGWYGKQPLDKLLHLWSVGDVDRWPRHRDLLHRCHFQDEDFRPEIMAALKLLSSSPGDLSPWPSFLSPLASCRPIIEGVVRLRLLQNSHEALPIVKKLALSLEHVPLHLLHDPGLSKFLLPRMSYDQMLQSWTRLSRRHRHVRFLEEQLKDEKRLKAGNVVPVRLLLEDMRVRKPKRVGQIHASASFLHSVYERSFGLNKALGRRLHITLNLEQCYMGKNLTGHCRSLKYVDALVALAFGYFRSDPKVTVQFWHDRSGELKTLPWTKEMSLAEAKACCEDQKVLKIKQSLTDILDSALKDDKNTYDVFLVLVPGAGRGNPGNSSKKLVGLLDEYREKRSSNAKFIMVTLRQNHASMRYGVERNENLLELCSLDEHTPRLINAFARRKFY